MKYYKNQNFDQERALYGIHGAELIDCTFEGAADGESALKECSDIQMKGCKFFLRYPLWHLNGGKIIDCSMAETCRAALWYDRDINLKHCNIKGIKALRECDNSVLENCEIDSQEFGWFCHGLKIEHCQLRSEYPFLQSCKLEISDLKMTGKYSFQYVEQMVIRNSVLDTKDAFWHSKNVTVIDSVIKGEYLAWYSENLKLIRCKIIGTQPLCYAKGLVLENCEMIDCDLSFENSDVNATVCGYIQSVKNPQSGCIVADEIGDIILDEYQVKGQECIIQQRKKVSA